MKKMDKEFQQQVDKMDQEFIDFLKKSWEELDLRSGNIKYTKPKPVNPPIVKPEDFPDKEKPRKEVPVKEKPKKEPEKEKPQKEKKETEVPKEKVPPKKTIVTKPTEKEEIPERTEPEFGKDWEEASLPFFGTSLQIKYKGSEKKSLQYPINNEKISNYWKEMSLMNYKEVLEQAQNLKKKMNLNDWGYYLLLNNLSNEVFGNSGNEQVLFLWFLLLKSGYDAKIGYNESNIFLLLPFDNIVFEIKFLKVDNKRYYTISEGKTSSKSRSLYTYTGNYPDAKKNMDLNVYYNLQLGEDKTRKDLMFSYYGEEFSIPITINNDIVDFYSTYPGTELPLYFNATVAQKSAQSLKEGLKPLVLNKSEEEAVNILLHFVQKAFEYKIDQEQFGKEKTLFIEESLFYPYSDCEDRSVLFAYLTRELTGLKVIGIEYEGHLATAVKFNEDVSGDAVHYKNEKYIICDPTYINADAGLCMPQFKGINPKVISIK